MQTRLHFVEELTRLNHDVQTMGIKVEENFRKAIEALKSRDVELARDARAGDGLVNALQLKIEDQAAALLATQQPVARDLRELVTVFKVVENLERAGDHARHLAKLAIKLADGPEWRQVPKFEAMVERCCAMIKGAVEAYLEMDAAKAREVAAMDKELDVLDKSIVGEVLEFMREHPDQVEQATRILSNAGYLERVGDHMTNICEGVVFMVEGEHVELND